MTRICFLHLGDRREEDRLLLLTNFLTILSTLLSFLCSLYLKTKTFHRRSSCFSWICQDEILSSVWPHPTLFLDLTNNTYNVNRMSFFKEQILISMFCLKKKLSGLTNSRSFFNHVDFSGLVPKGGCKFLLLLGDSKVPLQMAKLRNQNSPEFGINKFILIPIWGLSLLE